MNEDFDSFDANRREQRRITNLDADIDRQNRTASPIALDREDDDPIGMIPEELGGHSGTRHSFMVVQAGTKVRVYGGYRKVIGGVASLYGSLLSYWEFDFTNGNVIQFAWTYSTQSGGTITAGSWSNIESASEDTDDETKQVFVIAEMMNSGNTNYVIQRHCGDAVVEDRIVCVDCP
jgi:hypothetical protein